MVCVLVPLLENCIYPAFNKCAPCTPLRRITIGMIAATGAFVVCGFVQLAIDHSDTKISVAWQLPQWLLIAVSEAMIAVSGLQFAYTQCGPHLKGTVQALWSLMQTGQLLSGAFALSGVGHATQYFVGSIFMGAFVGVFIVIAVRYKYRPGTVGTAAEYVVLVDDVETSGSAQLDGGKPGSGTSPLVAAAPPGQPPASATDALLSARHPI